LRRRTRERPASPLGVISQRHRAGHYSQIPGLVYYKVSTEQT
jgi:hypothetical protein